MAKVAEEDLITQAEAARIRGVTRPAIAYLVAQGRLHTHERYGLKFVSRGEVEGYEPLKPGPAPKQSATTATALHTALKTAAGKHPVAQKRGAKK